MIAKRTTTLIAVLVSLGLSACGSSGSSSSSSSSSSGSSSSTSSSAAPAATSTTSTAASGGAASTPNQQAQISACQSAFAAVPLPTASKPKLASICTTAVNSEKGGATPQQVAKQVCPQIVNALPSQIQPIMQAECSKL